MTKQKIALLIIDHGSKYPAANESLDEVASYLRKDRPDLIIETAHMELAEPTIRDGYIKCVSKGATHIIAHPYMLSKGRHAVRDIPNMVMEVAAEHPEVKTEVTEPLGPHSLITSVILERAGL